MTQATNVARGLDPVTGEAIDGITATNLRRHYGNTLVNPPVKFNATHGIVEQAVLDGKGGYFYPSERQVLPTDEQVLDYLREISSFEEKSR